MNKYSISRNGISMTVEYFNSFGGYSVGIPPVPVVDTAGNVISNFNNLSGNVSANKVYANTYFFANGQPLVIGAAGSNTQLQYNNQGSFAGIPNVTWNGSVLTLGTAEAVSIGGGLNGYYLQTDGAGGLTWGPGGNASGGNGSPGGANMQVQFNDEGNFGGYAGFIFDKDTGTLNAPGNVIASHFIGNVETANYVIQNAQSNITSVGTLTALEVSGVTSLGTVSNVHITGGHTGYALTTDGAGNLSWQVGGGGPPGGSNTQIQYNDVGGFGGSPYFTFDEVSHTVQVSGNLIANAMQLGSGAYKFCSSFVYFSTTSSITPKQVIYSISVSDCSGVEFEIIGTDSIGQKRQFVKISSLYYAGIVTYNEYAGLYINGGVGSFEVLYNPGTVIQSPSLDLVVTPDTVHNTVYKMWISVLGP